MPLDPITLGVVAAIAVVVIAIVIWQVVAVRKTSRARDDVLAAREQLSVARARRETATGAETAAAEDAVQAARRAVNAATREGEALRKRFPTSLYAGRIPAPEYEESGGGTAEPPRIAF